MAIPRAIKVEAKFTTGKSVSIPTREREALSSGEHGSVGVVAVLFWCGDRAVDGRWLIVDAKESFGLGRRGTVSATVGDLSRRERNQPWLADLREYIETYWRPFLNVFLSVALDGHEHLLKELQRLHQKGELKDRVQSIPILDIDHKNAVRAILERHGEAGAGRIFQDLLAYVLGMAGYTTVRINPVGVPDIEVTDLADPSGECLVLLGVSPAEVRRIVENCKKAGDSALAEKILRMSQS